MQASSMQHALGIAFSERLAGTDGNDSEMKLGFLYRIGESYVA
jgi:hypothetical protein